MSAPTSPERVHPLVAFRTWRRSRPFWGGVTAILAGLELYGLTAAPFSLMVIQGVAGISALVICVLLILLAVVTWLQPHLRTATGLSIVVLSLASILLTNLGGFLLGMLLGLHGGASIAAWKPLEGRAGLRRDGGETDGAQDDGVHGDVDDDSEDDVDDDFEDDVTDDDLEAGDGHGADDGHEAGDGHAADDGAGPTQPDPAAVTPLRRRRPAGPAPLLGILLMATLASLLGPAPRTSAATAAPADPVADQVCAILPFLCPDPSPNPTPTPSPPTSPGTPAPATPSVPATACDPARIVGRPVLGSVSARTAASVLKACLAARDAGSRPVSTAATASGVEVVASAVPAHLVATRQTMTGLGYDGVQTVRTASGTRRVLKFHAATVTIEGLRQDVARPGVTMALSSRRTVTLSGHVQLYVLSQSGKAFGLLPLTLTPDSPPPLVTSYMEFTEVDSRIAYLEADSLSVPGGRIVVT